MRSEWFLKSGDQIKGPIPIEKIAGAIAAGKMPGADIVVSRSSDGPWQPIHSVPEFAELMAHVDVFVDGDAAPQQLSGAEATPDPATIRGVLEKNESLGDQPTHVTTGPDSDPMSLGDQITLDGGHASEFDDLDDDFEDGMEVVDLSSRYEIEGVIGQGGMGKVLRARDRRLDRPVAIKRVLGGMADNKKVLDRFLIEAQSVAKLNHFSIVRIYDYGRGEDGPFIIMELVDGRSLQQLLNQGPLDLGRAIDMICQLCDGLSVAHHAGIVHRDIKPANILLTQNGDAKLTDFGLARQSKANFGHTTAGSVLGTLDFMSPEQRRDAARTDARSDLWSLAATLYQMVTGRSPKVIRLDLVEEALRAVLGKGLEENPQDRFQGALEFRDALRLLVTEDNTATSSATDDFAKGQCPNCAVINDTDRKFCESCGGKLREPCLNCEREIAIWDRFCPECGIKLDDFVETKLAELDQERQQIESLRREYDFEQALERTTAVMALTHSSFEKHRLWAEALLQVLKTEYAVQRSRRDSLVAEAQSALQEHRYDDVSKLLDGGPVPLQCDEVSSLLTEASSRNQELRDLLQEIRKRIANRSVDGLWELTERCLELSPEHTSVSSLHKKLQARKQKREEQTTALLDRAEQEYTACKDKAVLGLLAKWPQGITQPQRVTELLELSRTRDEWATELGIGIQQAVAAKNWDGLQPRVDEYLTLRPHDEAIAALKPTLRKHENRSRSKLRKWNWRKRKVWTWAATAGGFFVLLSLLNAFGPAYFMRSGFDVAREMPASASFPLTPIQTQRHQAEWADYVKIEIRVTNSVGMKLTLIPPGEFMMGSPESELHRDDDELQHRVQISRPYYLGTFEVTQAQYQQVTGSNPSDFRGSLQPVQFVSWIEAADFCRKLSELPQEQAEGNVYRLPTEAEWEYACRAGTDTVYNFGSDSSQIDEHASYYDNSSSPWAIGQKKPNAWGLYDMHGNVWEWCQDWYSTTYYANSSVHDPQGPTNGTGRVYRGGAWNFGQWYCRSAFRYWNQPDFQARSLGFRVVRIAH
ncbi:MAG: SUMF1/EgtB/PvdO family nonheme iron enzyme [Planctomycetaceae bacterium]